jgi:signal transduction histidine kinase
MITELQKEASNLSVLFVEDDQDFTAIVKELLDRFFAVVEVCKDGEEGLAKYIEYSGFDIVITDVTMPRMNGLVMSEKIKEINPTQYILAISAHSDADKLIKAINIGIESFLLKPVDVMVLLDKLLAITKIINRQRLADREQELEKMLLNQSKMAALGEMLNIISHQLKQPLSAMNILSESIEKRVYEIYNIKDEEITNTIHSIQKQVYHMSSTIDTFSNFLKPTKATDNFWLKKSIDDILSILSAKLHSKDIEVILAIDENIHLYGYEKELNQAILNIISNAIDAFDPKCADHKLWISAAKDDKKALITIEDSAGGINEDVLVHVFEPYISTKGESGTGIGLYITKKIIEQNFKGSITVNNSERGAKFEIELFV